MANKRLRSLKRPATNTGALRERAIAEYHELLAADETLTPATFEKLRSAMRKNRLLYGDRPISRPMYHGCVLLCNYCASY